MLFDQTKLQKPSGRIWNSITLTARMFGISNQNLIFEMSHQLFQYRSRSSSLFLRSRWLMIAFVSLQLLLFSASISQSLSLSFGSPNTYHSSSVFGYHRQRSWQLQLKANTKTKQLYVLNGDEELNGDNVTNNDDDVDHELSCLPPGRLPEIKRIFLISDATGVMSRSILLKALAQFDTCADEKAPYATQQNDKQKRNSDDNGNSNDDEDYASTAGTCDVRTRTFTFVRTESALSQILRMAKERNACVMYTIAQSQLREHARMECGRLGLTHCVDLIGPSLDALSNFLEEEPLGIPALFLGSRSNAKQEGGRSPSNLSDSYYRRIDAVEFCLKADDGQAPWLLPEADIVLVGVSRSGKTPLSVVLSQTMSLKVANIPLVMEVPPPVQLLEQVDPNRVFCLTISPSELRRIRTNRLEKRGVKEMEAKLDKQNSNTPSPPKSNYADRNYILKDLSSVRKLCQKHNWTEIDVTGRAVEETATSIVEIFNQRFSQEGSSGISNQHIG